MLGHIGSKRCKQTAWSPTFWIALFPIQETLFNIQKSVLLLLMYLLNYIQHPILPPFLLNQDGHNTGPNQDIQDPPPPCQGQNTCHFYLPSILPPSPAATSIPLGVPPFPLTASGPGAAKPQLLLLSWSAAGSRMGTRPRLISRNVSQSVV